MQIRTVFFMAALVATGLLAGQTAAEEAAPAMQVDAATNDFIAQTMAEAGIVGLGAAIIVDKKLVWMKGYGMADRERGRRFEPDTVMNIGSISKTFTAAAMMQAVQDGKLALDADINTYLPFKLINPFHPNEKITLRHLATHSSGITDRWSVYQGTYHYGEAVPGSLGDFLQSYFVPGGEHYSKANFLDAKPGSHREYSNIGAGLAGYIVERAVGEPLSTYSKRHVFGPLQMNDSGWFLSEIDPAKHARLYVAQDGLSIPIPLYQGTTYPDGGVRTSVADLSKFFVALLNAGVYEGRRFLAQSAVEEMLRFQFTESDRPDNIDLAKENSGLFWGTKFSVTRVGHGGSDPGLKTEMLASLDRDVGLIMFTNTSLSGQEKRHFLAIFLELWKQVEAWKKSGQAPAQS